MNREVLDGLMESIRDMSDQISNLYYDALAERDNFEEGSEEWDRIDRAMDSIKDASDNLESAIDELS
jgi:methyl-accepting chemotaxis protein